MTRGSRLRTIEDIVSADLCSGCGTCAFLAPHALTMVDDVALGRRPVLREGASAESTAPLVPACPGAAITRPPVGPGASPDLAPGWGSVLAMWEGWASDPAVRFAGSSGGAATALGVHAVCDLGYAGVLHTAARDDVPYLNRTVLSTTAGELLDRSGSRYAPASPCESLDLAEDADGPVMFVGKPCDVAGVAVARRTRPALDEKVALTVAVFCAGTPSTRGTVEMLAAMGVNDLGAVTSVRYRGRGWPGHAVAEADGADGPVRGELDYDGSWSRILQKHRQWRCRLCPDHTGELADVSVGDPWYRPIEPGDPGRSLVIARTERGRRFVESAVAAGALVLVPVPDDVLPGSQPNLLRTRGAVAARVASLRAMGRPTPRFSGFPMWRFWWSTLSVKEKARSTLGTVRRAARRPRRVEVQPMDTPAGRW